MGRDHHWMTIDTFDGPRIDQNLVLSDPIVATSIFINPRLS